MKHLLIAATVLSLLALPALAVDLDQDGAQDGAVVPGPPEFIEDALIAVVDTGDGVVNDYIDRLGALGYTVTPIGIDSGLDVLSEYGLVILPVSHAVPATYGYLDANAPDYHAYVSGGGGLWVGQPNPWGQPGDSAEITWVPYYLYLNNAYDGADCPAAMLVDDHCVTEGTAAGDHSFAGDTVLELGTEWTVLLEGGATGLPAVFVGEYGAGKVLVELGHPNPGAICSPSDAALQRYVECIYGGATATDAESWSTLKSLY